MKIDFFQQLEAIVLTHLSTNRVDPELSMGIGQSVINDVARKFGGTVVYIKNRSKERTDEKRRKILADFNGSNHRDICQKYRISELWLKKLLKRAAEAAENEDVE
jgi:Mor family transcriptional regulator